MTIEKRTVRVLVLEDSAARIDRFKKYFASHNHFVFDADFTDDADVAVDLFSKNKYDLLFLDHDLEHGSNPSHQNTGRRFTKTLFGHANAASVVLAAVHSLNPSGRGAMNADLTQAGIANFGAPFIWDDMPHAMVQFVERLGLRGGGVD